MTNPNEQQSAAPGIDLKKIIALGGGLAFAATLAIALWMPGRERFWGIGLGFFLAVANLIFLTKIVAKLLNRHYSGAARTVAVVVGKFGLIAAVFYVAFWVLDVDALAFAGGYVCLTLSLMLFKDSYPIPSVSDSKGE